MLFLLFLCLCFPLARAFPVDTYTATLPLAESVRAARLAAIRAAESLEEDRPRANLPLWLGIVAADLQLYLDTPPATCERTRGGFTYLLTELSAVSATGAVVPYAPSVGKDTDALIAVLRLRGYLAFAGSQA